MVEIAISVAAKIAEYLVAPVGRPFRYLWNYKTNLENLKNEVEELKAKRDSVKSLIRVGEEPLPHVEKWQKSANQTIVEASKVVEDNPEQANIQCCKGFSCPNLINRYQRGKNAAEKLKEVLKLEQEAVPWLAQISSRTNIPDDPWLRSDDGYEAFDSRSSVLKNIIDALRDPNVNMVGIYGMGGIGKTTLAQKVAIHTKQDNLFNVIVFVEVSKTPDIKNIQQEIGGKLRLKFHDKTEGERARELYDQLKKDGTVSVGAGNSGEEKKEKKILLILDNIWGKIDLEKVGIPLGGDCKGLKLLLTTRSIHVLTNQMNSLHNFSVETLEEAEAWSLFKSTAGMCVDHPDLKNIAPKVAKECGNLPLAIVTIASALKDKEESTWSTALNELKNPSLEGFEETMTREVYTCIKFSYDYLDTKELKEIFLLCSRMGRTYDASIRDLFMYGLGLGFFKRFNTLEEAQCKVEDLVKKLKGNSLLLDAPNETRESLRHVILDGERFAMHDVICDVARLIDRQKGNVCNVIDDAISCRWAGTNILKNCTSITLYNISEVPEDLRLELPHLEFFYMKTKDSFSKIVDDFFVKMPSLLVLHLIEMNLSPLPTSLSNLINLHTLCLDACKLGDIADIGKLEKLEFLSFCGSEIRELPEEMRQLTSIRLLDLNDCSKVEIIPPNFLSCFTQLEALYMFNTLNMWEGRELNIGRILDELKHLRDRLTTLEICIPNVKMSEGLLSQHLKRYKICIGHDRIFPWILPPKNSRTLRVKLNTNDNADEVISQLKGIKQLELGCADRIFGFTAGSKQSVSLDALFSLESLSLEQLNLEKICNVPLAAESFCQLRTISVHGCDKLTNIFSFSIDRVLPKLQEITVCWCKNMEGIFAIEREDDVNNSELIHEIQFSQLCSVNLIGLRQLKSFCHRVKTTSQLQLTSSTNDGEIISEDMIDIPKSLFNEKVVVPNLNSLVVQDCDNLKELFSSSMVNSFVQLQYLKISKCSLLEEVVFMEELKEEERKDTQFPFLEGMAIIDCPNFKGFISNDKIGFPSLKGMAIYGDMHNPMNTKLKEFIFNDKVAVPNIEELTIWGMYNLKKIWHNQPVKDSFCKLKSLEVSKCKKLLNVFPSNICGRLLSSLESLEVWRCDSLKEIFDLKELSIYDSQIMLSFESLHRLEVSECGSLKNLFSASILAKEGVVMEEAPARFLFPKLTSLELNELSELRSFYPGKHKVEWPVLKKLELFKCDIDDTDEDDEDDEEEGHDTDEDDEEEDHDTDEEGQMQQYPFFLTLVEEEFPCLEELSLDGVQVTMLCQGQFLESLFDRLKILKVRHDESTVLPFGIIQRCQNLEELSLYYSSYEEIFPHREDQTQTKIKTLHLNHLNNLKHIWKQNPSTSFQNLTSLTVQHCNSLINMGTSSVAKSLVQLTEMSISSCEKITEVIGYHGDVMEDEIIFRKLKSLELQHLASLTSFCSWNFTLKFPSLEYLTVERCPNMKIFSQGDLTTQELQEVKIERESVELRPDFNLNVAIQQSHEKLGIHDIDEEGQMQQPFVCSSVEEIGFSSLKEMWIIDCPKLKEFIFNDKVAVPNLEELAISNMDNLEKIWHNQLVNDSFCKLKSLKVYGCKKLLNVFPSNICGWLLNLESLKVSGCDSLEEIFDLRELSIYDSETMLCFANLQNLRVSECHGLKNLFSASILAKEGVVMEEAPARFLFPKLAYMRLSSLPELRSFYPGRHKVEGPVLKKLKLYRLPELRSFQHSFFSMVEEAFPCLEELKLAGKNVMMLWQGQVPESLFDTLKILEVWYNESTVLPFGIIQRCQNLEKLSLNFSSYEEIFPHGEDQTQTKIKTLNLFYLMDLKYIWKQNSKLDLIIQNLEVLRVQRCDSLINLMPPPTSFQNPSTSFQNLTSLEVMSCNSLINMGISSVAKSLVQLTEMSISSCKKITEVIGNHGDVIEDEIIFIKLKSLQLRDLPSLTSFCSWNFTLKFPSLENLFVQQCPNIKIFSQGDLTMQKLQIVTIDWNTIVLRSDFNLNMAIQQSYEKANEDDGASSSDHSE